MIKYKNKTYFINQLKINSKIIRNFGSFKMPRVPKHYISHGDKYHGIQRTRDQVDIDFVFDSWLTIVAKLHNLCPYSRIIVSPILPTKIREAKQ